MRFNKENSYKIKVFEDLTRTYDLDKPIVIMIRVYLMVFAEKTTLLEEVMNRVIEEGYIKIPK